MSRKSGRQSESAIYSSVNHAVLVQQELGHGLKQDVHESIVSFLERLQDNFSPAYGPAVGWKTHHRSNLEEAVVKGVHNRRLSDLIARYQIPSLFSFVGFRDVVIQNPVFAEDPKYCSVKLEVNVVEGACFSCGKTMGNIIF